MKSVKFCALVFLVFLSAAGWEALASDYYLEGQRVFVPCDEGDYGLQQRDRLFPDCCNAVSVNIKTYGDIDRDLTRYKKFGFDYTSKENRLLEKELFHMLEKALVGRGLVRADDNPDFLITMNFFTGKREEYVPPQTITTSQTEFVWSSGMIGFTPTGQYTPVPVTSTQVLPGETKVSYYRNIRLNFLDMAELKKGKTEEPPLVWIGEAESQGYSSDIRTVAPVMLGELVWEFPQPSKRDANRVIWKINHGAIGVAVDPKDWNTIREVLPGSPAQAAGLVPGDQILSINDKRVKQRGCYNYWDRDPYNLFILSNKGDQEIELSIKSQDSKPRPVRLTPAYATRSYYWAPTDDGIGRLTEPTPWN